MITLASTLLASLLGPPPFLQVVEPRHDCGAAFKKMDDHEVAHGQSDNPNALSAAEFIDRATYTYDFLSVCTPSEIKSYGDSETRKLLSSARASADVKWTRIRPRLCNDGYWKSGSGLPHRSARNSFISANDVCAGSGGGNGSPNPVKVFVGGSSSNGQFVLRAYSGRWSNIGNDDLALYETADRVLFADESSEVRSVSKALIDAVSSGAQDDGLIPSMPAEGPGPGAPLDLIQLGYVLADDGPGSREALDLVTAVDPQAARTLLESARIAEAKRTAPEATAAGDDQWAPMIVDALEDVDSADPLPEGEPLKRVCKKLQKSAVAQHLLRIMLEDQPPFDHFDLKVRGKVMRYRDVEFKDIDVGGNLVFEQDGAELVVPPAEVRSLTPAN